MPANASPRAARMLWLVGAALAAFAAVVVFAVVAATGAQIPNPGGLPEGDGTAPVTEPDTAAEPTTTTPPVIAGQVDNYGIAVTDTTTAAAAAQSGADRAAQNENIEVTDTTLAAPAPGREEASTQTQQTVSTTTTLASVTTTTVERSVPRRVLHPTWDYRLPSTWEGLPASACAKETFRIEMRYDFVSWDHSIITDGSPATPAAAVISLALADPSYEVEPGRAGYTKMENAIAKVRWAAPFVTFEEYEDTTYKRLREGLTEFGVTSAQDIRDMGEAAANVRWYATWVKYYVTALSLNPDHPSCASILAGAHAVLTPYKPNTTTP